MSDLNDFDVPAGHTHSEILFPPSWQGLRQQIVYLAQFGNSVQVIHAEAGGGKTTFFNHLLDTGLGTTTVGISVAKGAGLVVFFRDVLRELGLRSESVATLGELAVSLRGYVQTLHKERTRAVLLVDNAHHLTDSELGALVSTLQGQADAGVGLHVVLFAEPGLAARIDALQVLDVAVHDAPLPVFSAAEIAQLAERTVGVGSMSMEQAQRIWYQSRGLPGKALGMLQELVPPSPVGEKVMSLRGLPIGHIAAVVVLCGVLIWAFMVRQTDEAPLRETLPPPLVAISPPESSGELATNPPLPETSSLPEEREGSRGAAPDPLDLLVEGQANHGAPSSAVPSEINAGMDAGAKIDSLPATEVEALETSVSVESQQQTLPAEEKEETPSSQVDSASPVVSTQTKPSTVSDGQSDAPQPLSEAGAKKLLSLPANGYVLQLMAASAEDKLAAYVAEQPNKANLYAYKTERGGKVLYILVEGYYADKASAQAAVLNLPLLQQKGGPWPKKIEQIHQELRNNR